MTDDDQPTLDALLSEQPDTRDTASRAGVPSAEEDPPPTPASDNSDPTAPAAAADSHTAQEPAEAKPPAEEPGGVDGPPRRLFFLTNRMNLISVLGSRIIAPREAYAKYYSDLLELCPGWVPLLTQPPIPTLVEQVIAERGAGAPVLIELSAGVVPGTLVGDPIVFVRAATLSDVTAIHFRDEKSLREHRSRAYSNVHPHEELLRVSPELFDTDAGVMAKINPHAAPPATDWQYLDRVRGAIGGALAASDSGEALAVVASIFGATRVPDPANTLPWLTWDTLTGLNSSASLDESATEEAERVTFASAYEVLRRRDTTQAWSPSGALDAVVAQVDTAAPSVDARAIIERNLQRVRELVDVERGFEPFRSTGHALTAAKALLLCLLRPDLEQLVRWPSQETGADDATRIAAAVLAGSLRGISRESAELRSVEADDLTAAWAVRTVMGEPVPLGPADFIADATATALTIDGRLVKKSAPLTPDPATLYEVLDSDARREARISVSRRLGWPVAVLVHVPPEAQVETSGSLITITSTQAVRVEAMVSEEEFVARLRGLSGQARRDAVAVLGVQGADPRQPG